MAVVALWMIGYRYINDLHIYSYCLNYVDQIEAFTAHFSECPHNQLAVYRLYYCIVYTYVIMCV